MLCWGLFGLNIINFHLDLITSYFIAKITKRPTIFSLFRLSDQQQLYSTLAARTLERTTHLGNTEERNTQKRLLISNIKLAIQNMFSYALSRAISLPGDREEEQIERGRRVGPVPEFQYKDPLQWECLLSAQHHHRPHRRPGGGDQQSVSGRQHHWLQWASRHGDQRLCVDCRYILQCTGNKGAEALEVSITYWAEY